MKAPFLVGAALVIGSFAPLAVRAQAVSSDTARAVLFVCEHGTVKSLLARVLFERYAAAAKLPVRAISRGTRPDSAVPAWMLQRLEAEGIALGAWHPQSLHLQDLASASYVVSFDVPRSATESASAPSARWDGLPSVKEDYAAGRAAIEQRVRQLVDSLANAKR